jgi:hypothetical protein
MQLHLLVDIHRPNILVDLQTPIMWVEVEALPLVKHVVDRLSGVVVLAVAQLIVRLKFMEEVLFTGALAVVAVVAFQEVLSKE